MNKIFVAITVSVMVLSACGKQPNAPKPKIQTMSDIAKIPNKEVRLVEACQRMLKVVQSSKPVSYNKSDLVTKKDGRLYYHFKNPYQESAYGGNTLSKVYCYTDTEKKPVELKIFLRNAMDRPHNHSFLDGKWHTKTSKGKMLTCKECVGVKW